MAVKTAAALAAALAFVTAAGAAERAFTLASTTSLEHSGLLRSLLPRFEATTAIRVRVLSVGTGQALELARRGDADAVLVHAPALETVFVAEGWGIERRPVLRNDFVLVGPAADPARVAQTRDAAEALRRIWRAEAPFVSRADRSGTHYAELELWRAAGVAIEREKGPWYRQTGSGMGPALNTAAGLGAYVLADGATWASFRNRGSLALLLEGDPRLQNHYSIILVNPTRHPHVRADEARTFARWLVSAEGQAAIAAFAANGERPFRPVETGGSHSDLQPLGPPLERPARATAPVSAERSATASFLVASAMLGAAFCYAAVGHGGASAYLAVMALANFAPAEMRPVALVLNMVVSAVATLSFSLAGYFAPRLFLPLAAASVPAAAIGGAHTLPVGAFGMLVGATLLWAAGQMWLSARRPEQVAPLRQAPASLLVLIGGTVGLLSGLTGVGGGVFLSPLLLFLGWAGARQSAAVTAPFVFLNSAAAYLTWTWQNPSPLPDDTVWFAVAVLSGGWVGAWSGSQRFGIPILRRFLAVVIAIAGAKMLLV